MLFEYDEINDMNAKIKIVGVGGGGGNAINRMIKNNLMGVEFISVNTDAQALNHSQAEIKIQIGHELTRGLGAGAKLEVGSEAANESKETLNQKLEGADMVFITAGMGGGTGTGAAPVIAKIAKDLGALTIGIVTKPFLFEGPGRTKRADKGIQELKKYTDTLIVVPNEKLIKIVDEDTHLEDAFKEADSILHQATSGISNLITQNGLVNLDFADVNTIMKDMGDAIIGTGTATGESRAVMAASMAISSPLLEDINIKGAKGVLINFTGGNDMRLAEINESAKIIQEEVGNEADIIFGTVINPKIKDEIQITVIATGFNRRIEEKKITNISSIALPKTTIFSEIEKEHEDNVVKSAPDEQLFFDSTDDFSPNVFDENDLEIPAFLRMQNRMK
ncbi:MAG: cell division protein FtsZ [Candidatus Marinimicrobia bacterium]|nr:cell division protein FtsZ [Candidatus Neomarinimicrobiota bacterium]